LSGAPRFFLRNRFGCVGVIVDAKVAALPLYGELVYRELVYRELVYRELVYRELVYRELGFRPLDAIQGTLGDRPERLPMFLAIRPISAALD
jgi:hypothetical protein